MMISTKGNEFDVIRIDGKPFVKYRYYTIGNPDLILVDCVNSTNEILFKRTSNGSYVFFDKEFINKYGSWMHSSVRLYVSQLNTDYVLYMNEIANFL